MSLRLDSQTHTEHTTTFVPPGGPTGGRVPQFENHCLVNDFKIQERNNSVLSSPPGPSPPSASRLSGCYESLEGGNTGDAVVDFSGAVTETINMEGEDYFKDQKKQDTLFEDLLKVYDRGGIISCSIKV